MGDAHASKPLKEEIHDEEDNRSLQNLEVEKLGHNQAMGLQSSSGVGAELAGMETCIVGTDEAHGKKPNKKPNKPLPCPRCESFDTKFCYFNNYNVNQPRHFCRKCQRYWTAGGLLRNVPRGAGRRRSKYNTTHQKHVVLSDAKAFGFNAYEMVPNRNSSKNDAKTGFLHTQKALFRLDVGRRVSEDGLSASSTMLSFGQQRPLCEVMAAHSLSKQHSNMTKGSFNEWCPSRVHAKVASDRQILEDEGNNMHASTSTNCVEAASRLTTFKHIHKLPEGLGMIPHYSQEKDGNVSSSSRILKQEEKRENLGLHNRPWHHFDAAKDSPTSTSASHCSSIPQCSFSSMKVSSTMIPSNCTSTHGHHDDLAKDKAMPMASDCAKTSEGTLSTTWNGLPDAMWAHPPWLFMPSSPLALDWAKAYWHMPWFLAALASSTRMRRPGLQSVQAGSEDEGCLWVPKTLRINDPVEAAQSSIWKSLGLDKAPGSSALKEDVKKAFQGEVGTQDEEESSTPSQHSNPAALSRSLTFNETT